MKVQELILILEALPEDEKQKPVMLEVEREIFLNVRSLRSFDKNWVTLSVFPDPFEEALKKAGVD